MFRKLFQTISQFFNNIWIAFFSLSMQSKLLAVFVFFISIPIIAVSYFSYQNYSSSLKQNTTSYATEITTKVLTKLDDYVTDLYNMSAMPLYNKDFIAYLGDNEMSVDKGFFIDLFINNLNKIKPDTTSVYLFDNYGRLFFNIKTDGKRGDLDEVRPLWQKLAREGDGSPRLVGTKEVSSKVGSASYYAFTVIREIKELSGLQPPIGFIAFDTKISAIAKSIKDIDAVTNGRAVLIDDQNRVIYDSQQFWITKDVSDDPSVMKAVDSEGSFPMTILDEDYIVTYAKSKLTGWRLIVYIPVADVTNHAAITRDLTIITSVVILMVALFISIAISYALTRPLRKIKQLMREVQRGKFDVSFNVKYSDEIGSLGTNFNIMVKRLDDLMEEVKMTQARKKEAELIALQSQINPHFIYNTLEMIRMTAEYKDDEEIAEMTFLLGKLLRYGINRSNEMVTIGDEMEHLVNYVYLQNLRFANRFTLQLDIPEPYYNYRCIKMIFQPIVENAINHAFKHKPTVGIITIQTKLDDDFLYFIVEDNGCGMSEEVLQRFINPPVPVSLKKNLRGIGLENVNERIKLHFGDSYGLRIESELGVGTRVIFLLPNVDPYPQPIEEYLEDGSFI